MGDVYAGDIGIGFLVTDSRNAEAEPTIDQETARAIVSAADGNANAGLSPANLFEISQEEFEFSRDTQIPMPGLPEGLTLWQVKR